MNIQSTNAVPVGSSVGSSERAFATPHRWCDQQCRRCPLRATCPAADQPIVELAPPIALDRERLRSTAVAHATATLTALEPAVEKQRLDRSLASVIVADAFAAAARIGRVLGTCGDDAIGHLLVLELLLSRVDMAILSVEALLPGEGLAQQRRCRWELGRKLEPAMRTIRPHHRAAMKSLVENRKAPSPFCIEHA